MSDEIEASRAPLITHLIELRKRVMISLWAMLIAFMGCYYFIGHIYAFLVDPLAHSFNSMDDRRLIYTSLTETFITYLKLAFYASFFVAFPIIASQFYLFLAPGLYKQEKRVLAPYLVLSPILFFAGCALVYFYVMPTAWKFFLSFEAPPSALGLPIQLEAKVGEYLSLVTQLLFAFGMSFQLPIVLTLLVRFGMLHTATLRKGRRYAIVILLTIAGLLTPPDILSQIALFIPLYLLYEISILTCTAMDRRKADAQRTITNPQGEPDHA